MSSGWSCSHLKTNVCDILKTECNPGKKGCVLYGKVKFSDDEDANEAYEKRLQRKMKKLLKKDK